ncbi:MULTISPECIES: matrixin family metalloprotease [unclassified Modestobacter]|uniref:matrixin family metalloprotease n=1 Tax=unclassified Modestobacter TaxID=2643866 RepID=UPI0022AA7B37|nr:MULTISPECIES: matrixin family metalloprotease [unclassified Modestobacter]MCZ2826659.1 matrixin family metalloprotease [Modestobacter sp. VKM Ac-2981]MCZ2855039.1 matrixin family metalloprotease [Modestobacter sp. VKM Ac-2982]
MASLAGTVELLPGLGVMDAGRTAPTVGIEAADDPLGTPLTPPAGDGTHQFAQLQDDGVTPIAYDPCRPVHYVVRPDNAPVGGDLLIADAVAQVSAVTGLQFVDDGATDEAPTDQRDPYQPDRYGDRWAPVLVTWDTVAEQPDLAADVAGLAGSLAVSSGEAPGVYVTGLVELDAAQFTEILSRPGGQAVARAIVLHEFAHLVGLDHVDDPTQLMYPTTSAVLDFAAGDLTGLSRLGAGACVPTL